VSELKELGVIISTVVCENPDENVEHQFRWISTFTGGKTVFLPELERGEVPISLPEIIQEWTIELSREYSNWLIVDVEWQDMDGQEFYNSSKAHFWLDFSYPSIVYYEKVVPSGPDVVDIHLYAEVLDFSPIAHVSVYHNGYDATLRMYTESSNRGGGARGTWNVNQMEYDNSTSLYFTTITGLSRGYNLSFFFEAADILKNAGKSPHYWIIADYQTKQWGEKTITPITNGESLYSLIEFQTDEPAFLVLTGEFDLSSVSTLLTSEDEQSFLAYSDKTIRKSESNDSYRILEYSLTEGSYFLNLTMPISTENKLTTLEYTWVQATSLSNQSMSATMDEKVRVHFYKWIVDNDTNIVVAYTPESDLVVRGSVFHANWSYIGDFSVIDAIPLAAGSYYVLIEAKLRTGSYEVILTDEVPNISDRYYATATPGFELYFTITAFLILGLFIHFRRRKISTRKGS
jgi:hypothetical protein